MKIKNNLGLTIIGAAILLISVGISAFQHQQAYAPRMCGGCDNQTIDDGNTTISTSATEAALKGSEKQKQLMNDKEVLRLNQSESSSLNMTDIDDSTLGSHIIGTLIGKAIGNSANSDDDDEAVVRPNQSDSLSSN